MFHTFLLIKEAGARKLPPIIFDYLSFLFCNFLAQFGKRTRSTLLAALINHFQMEIRPNPQRNNTTANRVPLIESVMMLFKISFVINFTMPFIMFFCVELSFQEPKKSSSSDEKSSSALDLPPNGSPSRIFCKLLRPHAIPQLPFELNA